MGYLDFQILAALASAAVLGYVSFASRIKNWKPRPLVIKVPVKVREAEVTAEMQTYRLIPIWRDIQPAPLKVFAFNERRTECHVVMHGPFNGVVKRLLLFYRAGKTCKAIRLDPVCGVQLEDAENVYAATLEEARKIASGKFGKKDKRSENAAPRADVPVARPSAVPPVAPAHMAYTAVPELPAPPPAATPHPAVREERAAEAPVITKGFIGQHVGNLVSFGAGKHPQGYSTYNVTLSTPDGKIEVLSGFDLSRAIADSGAIEGDRVRVIHVKNQSLPEGRIKKIFHVVKMGQPI